MTRRRGIVVVSCSLLLMVWIADSAWDERKVIDRCERRLETAKRMREAGREGRALRLLNRAMVRIEPFTGDPEAFAVLCDLHIEKARLLIDPTWDERDLDGLRFESEVLDSVGQSCVDYLDAEQTGYLCKTLAELHGELFSREHFQRDGDLFMGYIACWVRSWNPQPDGD